MLLFNRLGLVFFLVAFGSASGLAHLLGRLTEGIVMMIAGPLLAVLDAGYRRVRGRPLLRPADGGGTVLLLPAWLWGLFWTGLGAWYQVGRG